MSQRVNAADENQVKAAKDKEQLRIEQDRNDMLELLALPAGRRVLWRIMADAGVYRQSATQSGSWTYYNEGQRSVGNMILKEITECNPDAYLQMMKENKEKK